MSIPTKPLAPGTPFFRHGGGIGLAIDLLGTLLVVLAVGACQVRGWDSP